MSKGVTKRDGTKRVRVGSIGGSPYTAHRDVATGRKGVAINGKKAATSKFTPGREMPAKKTVVPKTPKPSGKGKR
jgi:hypothetical protein